MLEILQIIAAVGTILTGLYLLLFPTKITGFTGIHPEGGRGITEVRAVMGGVFLALGILPLVLANTGAYLILGIVYLTIGGIRAVSMFLDRSVVSSNIISLVVEVIFGIILVL